MREWENGDGGMRLSNAHSANRTRTRSLAAEDSHQLAQLEGALANDLRQSLRGRSPLAQFRGHTEATNTIQ